MPAQPAGEGSEHGAPADPAADRRGIDWPAVRRALADLGRDYHWPTKLAMVLLILSLLGGFALAVSPGLDRAAPRLAKALTGDAFQSLLTLVIGLLIAVNFYARARRGVLDGDEHYNIARALAFGYFKNFLVPALRLAAGDGRQLQVFRPGTMSDLRAYSREIEPRVRSLFEHDWLPVVLDPKPGDPPRRTVLSLQRPRPGVLTGGGAQAGFFFDAPTALFTVQDFYAALNRRREDDHKEPLSDANVLAYQNGQIESFFNHLDFLFVTQAGLSAVADLVGSLADLGRLRESMGLVTIEELRRRYPTS